MGKKWLIAPIVAASVGSGFFIYRKLFNKKTIKKRDHREELIESFICKGYRVHAYNQNNDFILFHFDKNEKIHLLYDDGTISEQEFFSKLNAYYLHFTNEFLFVSKDTDTLEKKTKSNFYKWYKSIESSTLDTCGEVIVHFQTFDEIIGNN